MVAKQAMQPFRISRISRTKTVATVGPASREVDVLIQLINEGVDVFRLNMAHGTREDHEAAIANIRKAEEKTHHPVGILIDLAGPKIRLGQLAGEPILLENGQSVAFVRGTKSEVANELTSIYPTLIDEVDEGDAIVLGDGMARLKVTSKTAERLECEVVDGGNIRSRQGINLPGTNLSVPALGKKDIDNAVWAAGKDIDFVSLSFVRNADEISQLKSILSEHGSEALTIAKIEKAEALENLEDIVATSGAIMVARGDLGVEIEIEKTPLAQKRIIKTCQRHQKPVIVATQMLESMHTSKLPTRAEVSDVANAILDGADACMLSGETAIGEYPVHTVKMMQKIMLETEQMFMERASRQPPNTSSSNWQVSDAMVFGSAQIAKRIAAKFLVISSSSSEIALIKSKQRDYIKTVCVSNRPKNVHRMCLYWGIVPVFAPHCVDGGSLTSFVDHWAKDEGEAHSGDSIVIVCDTELLPGVHDTVLVTRVS